MESVARVVLESRAIEGRQIKRLSIAGDDGAGRRHEGVREAEDPARTAILGNIRFTYLFRDVDMSDYPPIAAKLGLSHWKMDNDPVVWKMVEGAIFAEVADWQLERQSAPAVA